MKATVQVAQDLPTLTTINVAKIKRVAIKTRTTRSNSSSTIITNKRGIG
jgi:hypothetical protein